MAIELVREVGGIYTASVNGVAKFEAEADRGLVTLFAVKHLFDLTRPYWTPSVEKALKWSPSGALTFYQHDNGELEPVRKLYCEARIVTSSFIACVTPKGRKRAIRVRVFVTEEPFRSCCVYSGKRDRDSARALVMGSSGSRHMSGYALARALVVSGLFAVGRQLADNGYPMLTAVFSGKKSWLFPCDSEAVEFARRLQEMAEWQELLWPVAIVERRFMVGPDEYIYVGVGNNRMLFRKKDAEHMSSGWSGIRFYNAPQRALLALNIGQTPEKTLEILRMYCASRETVDDAVEVKRNVGRWPWELEVAV